jgi:carbamoyl-phosphate synthase small subunit
VTSHGPPALLVLEDGTAFRGRGFGSTGEAFGEAVFNTAMSGYQEVLTDPSYADQIVAMTAPHQGNYGVNPFDPESDRVQVSGFVVRELSRRPSSWRATGSLGRSLAQAGVVGLEGIDTRRLTLRIREGGAMRAGLSSVDLDPSSLVERVRTMPPMDGTDLATTVSCDAPYEAGSVVGAAQPIDGRVFRVAAYDFGIKRNILRSLARNGCEATVFPAKTPSAAVLGGAFEGVFLSNGPGDPAATTYGVEAVRGLLGKLPVFGICLGHQLMALALGGRTYKLRFGHRGVNQPVKDLDTGRVEITSHNHGFAVDPEGWGGDGGDEKPIRIAPRGQRVPVVETTLGRVALTHWNLNDGTLEGLRCPDIRAFSVQYHPEASPGPHDSGHLFARFRELMA